MSHYDASCRLDPKESRSGEITDDNNERLEVGSQSTFVFKYVPRQKLDKIMEKIRRETGNGPLVEESGSDICFKAGDGNNGGDCNEKVGGEDESDNPNVNDDDIHLKFSLDKKKNLASCENENDNENEAPRESEKSRKMIFFQASIEKAQKKLREEQQRKEINEARLAQNIQDLNSKYTTNESANTYLLPSDDSLPRSLPTLLDLQMRSNLKEMEEIEQFHLDALKENDSEICSDVTNENFFSNDTAPEPSEGRIYGHQSYKKVKELSHDLSKAKWVKLKTSQLDTINEQQQQEELEEDAYNATKFLNCTSNSDVKYPGLPVFSDFNEMFVNQEARNLQLPEYPVYHQSVNLEYNPNFDYNASCAYEYPLQVPEKKEKKETTQTLPIDSDFEYEMQRRPDYTKHCFPRPKVEEAVDNTKEEVPQAEFLNLESCSGALNLNYIINKAPMRFTDYSETSEHPEHVHIQVKSIQQNKESDPLEALQQEIARDASRRKSRKVHRKPIAELHNVETTLESDSQSEDSLNKRSKNTKDRRKSRNRKVTKDSETKPTNVKQVPVISALKPKEFTLEDLLEQAPMLIANETPKKPKILKKKSKEASPRKMNQNFDMPVVECIQNKDGLLMKRTPRANKSARSPRQAQQKQEEIVTEISREEKKKVFSRISGFQEQIIDILDNLKMCLVEMHNLDMTTKSKNYKATLEFAVQFARNYLLPLKTMIDGMRQIPERNFTKVKSNASLHKIIEIYKLIIEGLTTYKKHIRYFCIDTIPNKLISLLEHLHDITHLTIAKGIFNKDDIVIDCLTQRCFKFVDFIHEKIEERVNVARTFARSPTRSIQSHFFARKPKGDPLEMYNPQNAANVRPIRPRWMMSPKDKGTLSSKLDIQKKFPQPELDPEEDAVAFDDKVETQVGATKREYSKTDETLKVLNNLLLNASCSLLKDRKVSTVTNNQINLALIEALQKTTKKQVLRLLEPYLHILDSSVFEN